MVQINIPQPEQKRRRNILGTIGTIGGAIIGGIAGGPGGAAAGASVGRGVGGALDTQIDRGSTSPQVASAGPAGTAITRRMQATDQNNNLNAIREALVSIPELPPEHRQQAQQYIPTLAQAYKQEVSRRRGLA